LVGWIIAVLAAIPLHFMEDLPNVLSYTCTSCFSQGRMPRYAKGRRKFLQIGKIHPNPLDFVAITSSRV
jgi:hypothetical protein